MGTLDTKLELARLKIRYVSIAATIFLMATIVTSIYTLNLRSKQLVVIGEGVGSLTSLEFTNRTAALQVGLKGYILAQLAEPTEPIVIPAKGALPVTVELWFVSFDWDNLWSTNITLSPQVNMGNLTTSSQPNGAMTLQINKPAIIKVTLHNSGSESLTLGGVNNALIVDIHADYPVLDSTNHVNTNKPKLSVHPSNITDEDTVTIKVFNPGPWNVEFGFPFNTEKMVNGSWAPVEDNTTWILPLIMMGAGSDWSQRMNITGLDSGFYRISKEITYNSQKQIFYAEFNVTRPT